MSAHPYDDDLVQAAFTQKNYGWQTEYLRPLAKRSIAEAECMLGVLYQLGLGVELDPGLAEKWFLRAARKNFPIAWCNLGTLYLSGAPGKYPKAKLRIVINEPPKRAVPATPATSDCLQPTVLPAWASHTYPEPWR